MLAGLLESDVLLTKPSRHIGFMHVALLHSIKELGEQAFTPALQLHLAERLGRGISETDLERAAAHLAGEGLLVADDLALLSAEIGPEPAPFRLTRAGLALISG